MPTTKVERVSDTRVKLTISVSPAELKPSIDHAYQHIAEQVQSTSLQPGLKAVDDRLVFPAQRPYAHQV